jgi:predicted membrane chloride channel (bestrophin family)
LAGSGRDETSHWLTSKCAAGMVGKIEDPFAKDANDLRRDRMAAMTRRRELSGGDSAAMIRQDVREMFGS